MAFAFCSAHIRYTGVSLPGEMPGSMERRSAPRSFTVCVARARPERSPAKHSGAQWPDRQRGSGARASARDAAAQRDLETLPDRGFRAQGRCARAGRSPRLKRAPRAGEAARSHCLKTKGSWMLFASTTSAERKRTRRAAGPTCEVMWITSRVSTSERAPKRPRAPSARRERSTTFRDSP